MRCGLTHDVPDQAWVSGLDSSVGGAVPIRGELSSTLEEEEAWCQTELARCSCTMKETQGEL